MRKIDQALLVVRLMGITVGIGSLCAALIVYSPSASAQPAVQAIPVVPAISASAPTATRAAPPKALDTQQPTASKAPPAQWVFMTGLGPAGVTGAAGGSATSGGPTAAPAPSGDGAPVDDSRIARARLVQPLRPFKAEVDAPGAQVGAARAPQLLPVASRRAATGAPETPSAPVQISSGDTTAWVRVIDAPGAGLVRGGAR